MVTRTFARFLRFLHLSGEKGVKELSVNVEDFLLTYTVTFAGEQHEKISLREFMKFKNNKFRKTISHVSTRRLSLGNV